MLHMSSTHQMQQIHQNDLTLICPYVGVMGVGVWCSLSETGSKQAKKAQPVNGNGQFSKKYGSGPPPPPTHTSLKSPIQGLSEYTPHNTQLAQIRQQWHRPPKTQKIGRKSVVPERERERYILLHPSPLKFS